MERKEEALKKLLGGHPQYRKILAAHRSFWANGGRNYNGLFRRLQEVGQQGQQEGNDGKAA
jgi:hypothetical protein